MSAPDEAVRAAARIYHNDAFDAVEGYSACSCRDADEHDEKWHADMAASRQALEAAAPLIAAAERERIRQAVTAQRCQDALVRRAASGHMPAWRGMPAFRSMAEVMAETVAAMLAEEAS